LLSRFVIGFGQASFLALCVTVIDDIAPAKYKSTYMSIFLSSTPFGIAAGYGIAGLVDAFVKWWQSIYFVEFLLSFSFAVLFLYVPLHGYDHTNEESTVLCESPSDEPEVKYNLITVLKPLFTNVTYVCHLAA
jgi:MFS family permease